MLELQDELNCHINPNWIEALFNALLEEYSDYTTLFAIVCEKF